MPASACSPESTYSQTGSRGEAWKRPMPARSPARLELAQELQRALGDVFARPLDRRPPPPRRRPRCRARRAPPGRGCRPGRSRSARGRGRRRRRARPRSRRRRPGTRSPRPRPPRSPPEHRFERRQVGVDIADCGDAHAGQRTPVPASIRWARRWQATDPIAELRAAVQSAADALREGEPTGPAARPWSARRSPSWATTAPTRRCCSPRHWAKTRATSPPGSPPS